MNRRYICHVSSSWKRREREKGKDWNVVNFTWFTWQFIDIQETWPFNLMTKSFSHFLFLKSLRSPYTAFLLLGFVFWASQRMTAQALLFKPNQWEIVMLGNNHITTEQDEGLWWLHTFSSVGFLTPSLLSFWPDASSNMDRILSYVSYFLWLNGYESLKLIKLKYI